MPLNLVRLSATGCLLLPRTCTASRGRPVNSRHATTRSKKKHFHLASAASCVLKHPATSCTSNGLHRAYVTNHHKGRPKGAKLTSSCCIPLEKREGEGTNTRQHRLQPTNNIENRATTRPTCLLGAFKPLPFTQQLLALKS